ncbi:MAG TPA: IS200/IS605 family transposase [Bacteroidia bacterium]|nr:IS200/IS605 family transposase [Bacteroidia bacterium]HRS59692.1 IS200/IS605 family transposase [Bacteroidia bacterium]HRU68612.1 IS200/IS605 family transposase [Bacteroidia bacterium]
MAGSYTQLYVHLVFVVKRRENLIQKPWREELFKYMSGIIKAKGQKPIIVNGVSDHVHIFIGLSPTITIADLVRDIKNNSSKFINTQKYLKVKFAWQEGYGAFSYSHSHVKNVYQYILNQEKHHQVKTFKDEYIDFLRKFEVDYDERFLFDWLE